MQEMFNKALKGVVGQGGPAFDGGPQFKCGDCRCNLGWLMTDEQLEEIKAADDFEKWYVSVAIEMIKPQVDLRTKLFLLELVDAHDEFASLPDGMTNAIYIEKYKDKMRQICFKYGLDHSVFLEL